MLTKFQPNICPRCDSDNVDFDEESRGANETNKGVKMYCYHCGKAFYQVFKNEYTHSFYEVTDQEGYTTTVKTENEVSCPHCTSDQIEVDETEEIDYIVRKRLHCDDCDKLFYQDFDVVYAYSYADKREKKIEN